MSEGPEQNAQLRRRRNAVIVLRAVIYALAIALLVVFGPAEDHVFIYQGF